MITVFVGSVLHFTKRKKQTALAANFVVTVVFSSHDGIVGQILKKLFRSCIRQLIRHMSFQSFPHMDSASRTRSMPNVGLNVSPLTLRLPKR